MRLSHLYTLLNVYTSKQINKTITLQYFSQENILLIVIVMRLQLSIRIGRLANTIICFKLRQNILPSSKNNLDTFLLTPTGAKHAFINLRMSLNNGVWSRCISLNGRIHQPHSKPNIEYVATSRTNSFGMSLHQRILPRHHHSLAFRVHKLVFAKTHPVFQVIVTGIAVLVFLPRNCSQDQFGLNP